MSRAYALILIGASTALVVGAAVCLALSFAAPLPDQWGFRGSTIIHAIGFTAVGAIVTLRRPANTIGWLVLIAGFVAALGAFSLEYGVLAILGPNAMPAGLLFAWLGSWIWVLYVAGILPLVLLLFPDGRLLSPRWSVDAGLVLITSTVTATYMALKPGSLQLAAYAENPFASSAAWVDALGTIGVLLILPSIGGASWSLVLRFRRSTGIEREQIKWLAFSAAPVAAVGFASATVPDKLIQVLYIFVLLSIPSAIGIAILRYRLYDIDVLINRALVYGATTLGIGLAFFTGVIVLQALLRPITGGSEVAVAASTLASVALFQPLRARMQRAVDRRFYRSRYDAARTLDAFSVRLRDEVDLDAVRGGLVAAVRDTVQPVHASVWLRGRPR